MNPHLPNTKPNFWLSCLLFDKECKINPIELIKTLSDSNVEARPIWKPMHLQPLYKDNDFIFVEDKSVSEDIFDRGICLPSDIKMTDSEQDYVIEIIKSYFLIVADIWATDLFSAEIVSTKLPYPSIKTSFFITNILLNYVIGLFVPQLYWFKVNI